VFTCGFVRSSCYYGQDGTIKGDPRLHTLIPRTTDRWKAIYRTRGAVEREFGRLKHDDLTKPQVNTQARMGSGPAAVRRLPRVRLHADLTILARLASALTQARAVPLAA
jgi:hypothetical protein